MREELEALLQEAVDEKITPGLCLCWGRRGEELQTLCAGQTSWETLDGYPPTPVDEHTVFDLASLTKPLYTTAATMLLVEGQELELEAPVSELLPEWSGPMKGELQLQQLLSHESGLIWWLPLYEELEPLPPGPPRKRWLRDRLVSLSLERAPGEACVYSDPGFLLLERALEVAARGRCLPSEVARRLWWPWGADLRFVRTPGAGTLKVPEIWMEREELLARADVAATERCPWRGRVLHGEVHDDNAWAMGGLAPHAGLFGRGEAVARCGLGLLAALAGEGQVLGRQTVQRFFDGGGRPGGATWALGWDRPSARGSSAGARVSPDARGHLGFTGTSLWLDPARDAVVALLTNRVAGGREDGRIRKLRPRVHDAVWALLDEGS